MSEQQHPAVARAIEHFGSQDALAERLEVRQTTVSQWLKRKRPVPEMRAAQIERETSGSIRCEETLPEVTWRRLKVKGWPWNGGKPLVDVLP